MRIVAIMQQWSVSLVNENKCKDAYQMLIKQGIPAPTETRTDCIHVPATDAFVSSFCVLGLDEILLVLFCFVMFVYYTNLILFKFQSSYLDISPEVRKSPLEDDEKKAKVGFLGCFVVLQVVAVFHMRAVVVP